MAQTWGPLTNHALVLIYVTKHSASTVRAISEGVGVTERATLSILRELDASGIIERHREGRRNTYSVDFDRLATYRRRGTVALTPREFDLLAYLVRNHGHTVTRQMLAKDVWREPHRATPLDNVIDVHVAHLRRKIDDEQRVKLIHTVRGVGFVLREDS